MKKSILAACGLLLITQAAFSQYTTSEIVKEKARYLVRTINDKAHRMTSEQLSRLENAIERAQAIADNESGGGGGHRPPPYEPNPRPYPRPEPTPVPVPAPQLKPLVLTEEIKGQLGTKEVAQNSYEAACNQFKRQFDKVHQDVRIQSLSCGPAQDMGGSTQYQYKSQGKVEMLVPEATISFTQKITGIIGTQAVAHASYTQDCQNKKSDLKADAGYRFVGALCGTPTDTGGSTQYLYTSTATFYVMAYGPTQRSTETINGYVGTREQAQASWDRKCQEWKQDNRTRYRGRLVYSDCGTTRDIGGSTQYQFTSTGTVHFEQ